MTKNQALFSKNLATKTLHVERAFDAPLDEVWDAWTKSDILDQWWAPRPYKAVTSKMDFRAGGQWLYAMKGPEGDTNYCRVDFKTVDHKKSITTAVMFCDEAGNINTDFPTMYWKKVFKATATGTLVNIEITFDKEADMETIIGMGFQDGFTAGLNNLDEVLAA